MSRKLEYISFAGLSCPIPVPQVNTREFDDVRHLTIPEFYTFLCSHDLSSESLILFLQQVKHRKEAVCDYIMTLPEHERVTAARKVVNFKKEWSALGAFFWLKRGRFEPCLSTGTLRSFADVMLIAEYQGLCALDVKELYKVMCTHSLPVVALELLHRDDQKKEQMRDYIMTLPWQEKISAVQKILHFKEEPSTLGEFFWLKRGIREPSLNSGMLKFFAKFFAGTSTYSSNKYTLFSKDRDSETGSLHDDYYMVIPVISIE